MLVYAELFSYKPCRPKRFFSIWNHHKCLSYLFPLHMNTYVMGLRPLEIFLLLQRGDRLYTSVSDVWRRLIMTYKNGSGTVRNEPSTVKKTGLYVGDCTSKCWNTNETAEPVGFTDRTLQHVQCFGRHLGCEPTLMGIIYIPTRRSHRHNIGTPSSNTGLKLRVGRGIRPNGQMVECELCENCSTSLSAQSWQYRDGNEIKWIGL